MFSFHPDRLEGVDGVFVGRQPWSADQRLQYLTSLGRVRRALSEFRPDVVYAPYLSSNGVVAALAWSGPLVVSARGGDVLLQAGRLPAPAPLHRWMMRFVCRRADRVHAVSEELCRALIGFGVPAERIVCFPIGVDTSRFRPGSVKGEVLRIVCTRRQEPVYENHVVIDALGRLRDRGVEFSCRMVGGGPLLEDRRAQVKGLGLDDRICFSGQLAHDELPRLLAEADLYVSAASSDGTSSSLLEAMASGCFPVLARIPANESWIIDRRTGAFFDVGDDAQLADRLVWAAQKAESRRHAATVNRAEVLRRGDMQTNMDRLSELLTAALPR
jgi:glycosyltransferase involved in cell wall biosynthesis